MDRRVEAKLTDANKLIFVKRYGEAEKELDAVLGTEEGSSELLVHLRRIELAAILKKLDKLRAHYLVELRAGHNVAVNETALALVEQHGDLVPSPESINSFQEILKKHGPSAAAYYGIGYAMEAQSNYERAIFNYEQALKTDPSWYLAYFGLSQIHYHQGDEKRGDHFFYLFEQAAPYNVYGNFETHRALCQEFTEAERYHEAEAAIQALAEWWIENKGLCPPEIQIYELLATARIAEMQSDAPLADTRRTRAVGLALSVLEDPKASESVLYFIAKVLEEFDDFSMAFRFYKRILKGEGGNAAMVQKIGSQFLSLGEYKLAKELFQEAYEAHPEHPDVRFCLLVSNLKLAGVNVEDYLIGRERLRQLVDAGEGRGDKVELLALLHSLLAKFASDSDVQGHIADVYLRLGNVDRAARHYQTMFELDSKNRATALKYAAFLMQYRDPDRAMEVLQSIKSDLGLSTDHQAEVFWLKSNYYARKKDYRESHTFLKRVLAIDPWNVSYLVQEVINLIHLSKGEGEAKIDRVLMTLTAGDDQRVDWTEFDANTKRIEREHAYELVYARCKLRYLYANGSEDFLSELVTAACRHDASHGTYDLMKLLNTNFDSHHIYWALGTIFKELWQLETASVWFEQMLLYTTLPLDARAKAYLELADCLIWQNKNLAKAVEYAKLAIDLSARKEQRAVRILGHAYLKKGEVRQAQLYLEQVDSEVDYEVRYLKGLLQYRNGSRIKANEIWKPLLTVRSESLRFHTIKQEVLKYYFDGEPYLKAN